jgi:hypothetical protein
MPDEAWLGAIGVLLGAAGVALGLVSLWLTLRPLKPG